MTAQEGPKPLKRTPEAAFQITPKELLDSQAVVLRISSELSEYGDVKMQAARNIHVIKIGSNRQKQLTEARITSQSSPKFELVEQNSSVSSYDLALIIPSNGGTSIILFHPNPHYAPTEPTAFTFPGQKAVIDICSVEEQPADLLVIRVGQHAVVRPLTEAETDLLSKKDEKEKTEQVQKELLRSQSVPFHVPDRLLMWASTEMHPVENIHIVNNGINQNSDFAQVELETIPYFELILFEKNGDTSKYSLFYVDYQIPPSISILPYPDDNKYLLDRPSVIKSPQQRRPQIKVCSADKPPSDLLMVIGRNGHCTIRPLTYEEKYLLVKRDEEAKQQTVSPQESTTVFQAPKSPAPGIKTEPTHKKASSLERRKSELQRERSELKRGNKGEKSDYVRSRLAVIDRAMRRLNSPKSSKSHDDSDSFYGGWKKHRRFHGR